MTDLHSRLAFLCGCLLVAPAIAVAQPPSSAFERLDRNGDRQLTREEFKGPLFDRIDANADGVITLQEDRQFRQRPNRNQRRPVRIPETVDQRRDLPYAGTDHPRQKLDLYLPNSRSADQRLPLVAFIHGGGWQQGNKDGGFRHIGPLVASGDFIGASIGYRLSSDAVWPAQIHDCKAAIRWLRANADQYGIDPDRIAVVGTSAGGHLVAMLGTSGGVTELEGELGPHLDADSRVQCVVDFYGPSLLSRMGGWHDRADSPEAKLLGGPVQDNPDKANQASPISHVSGDDPPFLMFHGTEDPVVPFDQSKRLLAAIEKAGVRGWLVPVTGGQHGGFPSEPVQRRMRAFLDRHLRGKKVDLDTSPIESGK